MHRHRIRITIAGTILTLLASATVHAQADQRCFPETRQCISGRLRQFWEENGGLPIFGMPITSQSQEMIEGKPLQTQWFERSRLELHPENTQPYDVLLGRLGAERLARQRRDGLPSSPTGQRDSCRFFPETRHNV